MTTTIRTTTTDPRLSELPTDLLERFRARAATRPHPTPTSDDDLAKLQELGYLTAARARRARWLGLQPGRAGPQPAAPRAYAPATALATTMHFYWTGIAAEFERAGDDSLRWISERVAGDVFAAGHTETGNDIPVLLSTCQAERVPGGYRLTGRKQFGSNGPVWSWLGAHAMDMAAGAAPGHPCLRRPHEPRRHRRGDVGHPRHAAEPEPRPILDGVFVPDERIGRVTPRATNKTPSQATGRAAGGGELLQGPAPRAAPGLAGPARRGRGRPSRRAQAPRL